MWKYFFFTSQNRSTNQRSCMILEVKSKFSEFMIHYAVSDTWGTGLSAILNYLPESNFCFSEKSIMSLSQFHFITNSCANIIYSVQHCPFYMCPKVDHFGFRKLHRLVAPIHQFCQIWFRRVILIAYDTEWHRGRY